MAELEKATLRLEIAHVLFISQPTECTEVSLTRTAQMGENLMSEGINLSHPGLPLDTETNIAGHPRQSSLAESLLYWIVACPI